MASSPFRSDALSGKVCCISCFIEGITCRGGAAWVLLLLLTRHPPVLQVALVTGGSSGIGLEISRQLGRSDIFGVLKA
jgi:hypothetical protein